MENKNNFNKKIFKKVSGIILTTFISAFLMIGIGFGFASSIKNSGPTDDIFNNTLQISTEVKISSNSGKNINDASAFVQDTLDFLGLKNSTVSVSGKRIIITNPISSYDESSESKKINSLDFYDIENDVPDQVYSMNNVQNNINYLNEVINFILPIIFNGTIDFRTTTGDPIFSYDSQGTYIFDQDNMEEANTIETPTKEKYINTSIITKSSIQGDFYTEANVKQINGSPVIEIGIKQQGNDDPGYINMFTDFNRWILDNNLSGEHTTNYIVYFDFDEISKILIKTNDNVNSKEDVYAEVTSNSSLRPLYVTNSNSTIMTSIYDDTIKLSGNFTDQQANYLVNKINNANDFHFDNFTSTLIINDKSKLILLVMAIILITIILIIIFSFVSYFGLLGVIASSIYLIPCVLLALIFSASGIVISSIFLMALIIAVIFSAYIFFIAVNTYKKNNEDKFISITTRFFDKYKEINKMLFFSIFSLVVIIYVSALMLSTIVTIALYLIAISIVISYVIISIILIPAIYGYDLLLEFSKQKENKKWSWQNGYNNSISFNFNTELKGIKKKTLGLSLAGLIVLLLSLVIGGSMFIVTGTAVNTNLYGKENYLYAIKVLDPEEVIINSMDSSNDGSYNLPSMYKNAETNSNQIEKVFKDNNVNVSSIDIVRYDEISKIELTNNEKIYVTSSFGYEIYSSTKIDKNLLNLINDDLLDSTEDIKYLLTEDLSIQNGNSYKIYSQTENKYLIMGILSLLVLIFIAGLITLLISNWGISVAVIITTILEIIFITGPLFILFIPYNLLVWFPIILILSISLIIKIRISQEAKSDEIKEDKWIKITRKKIFVIPCLSFLFLILELILIWPYGFIIMLPLLIVTITSPIVIFLTQQFAFPYFAKIFGGFRDKTKENKLQNDIRNSKKIGKNDPPREEMIKGVNM